MIIDRNDPHEYVEVTLFDQDQNDNPDFDIIYRMSFYNGLKCFEKDIPHEVRNAIFHSFSNTVIDIDNHHCIIVQGDVMYRMFDEWKNNEGNIFLKGEYGD